LAYLDPPFYKKADDLYRYFFLLKDHKKLYKKLANYNNNWILSYDNTEEIKQIYSTSKLIKMHIELPYSINSHAKRIEKELIITPLKLPDIGKKYFVSN